MGYIGKIPSAVPLTSADITDNVITSAKIVDGTITNTDIASSIITGQTAETSIDGADSVLIYDDSATALRKMTRTNFVAGIGGGLSEADAWRIDSNITFTNVGTSDITTNWERVDTDGFGLLGTGLTQSSGIFTFPSTGYYYINFFGEFTTTAARNYAGMHIEVTLNNSSYSVAAEGYTNLHTNGAYATHGLSFIIKVTDTANIKFKFVCDRSETVQLLGASTNSKSGFSCIKLAGV